MDLDRDICYRALRTRDSRFDGRFFTAVRTTGIYCRPVCPATTPKLENCTFFPLAAAAQEAGFRPCLRCRPEAAPGSPAWAGTSTTVRRALKLINGGALDGAGVGQLADRLGVGERHLRRLFARHVGASPLAVAQNRRLLFAKKLLDETDLTMTEVALAAGYSSLRRFNAALRNAYGRPPGSLRRKGGWSGGATDLMLELTFREPYHWPAICDFLGRRAIPGVDEVTNDCYRRTIAVAGSHGVVEVSLHIPGALTARIKLARPVPIIGIVQRLRRLFDLDVDPAEVAAQLAEDVVIGADVARLPGLRVPGAWDGFELGVRAILGQQVTVKGATTLAGRLVAEWGEPLTLNGRATACGSLSHVFPEAGRLAGADLTGIGLPRARAATISGLAKAIDDGEMRFDGATPFEAARAGLLALPGIGAWTADYIAMRALRDPDAFPAGDLGLRKAAAARGGPDDAKELAALSQNWRPWRAYAALLLWTGGTESE